MITFSPPAQDRDTSRDAARAIRPNAGTLRAMVRNFIILQGSYGATDQEIQAALNLSGDTERPRRVELWNAGFIIDSGMVRNTPSGLSAVVWRAA